MGKLHFYLEKFKKIRALVLNRVIPMSHHEVDSLDYWRERLLFSIIFSGLVLGFIIIIAVIPMAIEKQIWELVIFDGFFWILGVLLLTLPHIRFIVRATISVLIIYALGLMIIIFVGPLSGGPAWLFCFAVITGILLGHRAGILAVLLNGATLSVIGFLMTHNLWGQTFPFFNSSRLMVVAGINFLFLNALAAISVSVLVKGLVRFHEKEQKLTQSLTEEQVKLTEAKNKLEKEFQERRLAEKEKIKAREIAGEHKKLALVGQVAGKMAHDFNNILGIIMGNTELSILDFKDDDTKDTLQLILEQTIRGKNLTKNLVAFAKTHEPKQEFFKMNEKIDMVLSLLKRDLDGIEVIKEEEPGVPDVLADPGMIEHALVNLLQNSIHAISRVSHPRITVRSYALDNQILFEIEDNGCGIPSEHLSDIFEPSFTLKGSRDITASYEAGIKGTGYGMSNVKKYITQHNGDIQVVSTVGAGTKISLGLPVIQKELTSKEKKEITKEKIQCNKDILLVEDEPAIADVQYVLLTQEPCFHTVDIARNGQSAITLFNKNKYDFISLDFILPGQINGMAVYNHIRKTDSTIPIMFVSGNLEFLESIKDLKQKDANIDHLSKPFRSKEYVSSVNRLLVKASAKRRGTGHYLESMG